MVWARVRARSRDGDDMTGRNLGRGAPSVPAARPTRGRVVSGRELDTLALRVISAPKAATLRRHLILPRGGDAPIRSPWRCSPRRQAPRRWAFGRGGLSLTIGGSVSATRGRNHSTGGGTPAIRVRGVNGPAALRSVNSLRRQLPGESAQDCTQPLGLSAPHGSGLRHASEIAWEKPQCLRSRMTELFAENER